MYLNYLYLKERGYRTRGDMSKFKQRWFGRGERGLKFGQMFLSNFFGFAKFPFLWVWQISSFFGSSNSCITHLNPLNEEHTVLMKNKIIVAFQIYLYKYDIETEKLILGIHFFAVCILSLLFIYLFIYFFFFGGGEVEFSIIQSFR